MLACGLVAAVLLAGCGGESSTTSTPPGPSGPAGTAAPASPANCTTKVSDSRGLEGALDSASAGEVVCVSGDLSDARMEITKGGSAARPLQVLGNRTRVGGITVEADNVVVDGFVLEQPEAPGASLKGDNITLRNTSISDPQEGDNDGIRFWGNNIKILHNTVSGTQNTDGSHADCMQTFATDSDHPASQNVLIDSNRCEEIDNNCIIAEGPNSSAGDGSGDGESRNITFSNNYCDNHASQAVMIDDVRNVTVVGNEIVGRINHAFAFQNEATDAVVRDNRVGSGIKFEVGMDDTSESGYQGPRVGGAP